MSDLTQLQIDPNVEETSGAFSIIPAGNYKAVIVADRLVSNKANTGKILEFKVQLTDGPNAGETIVDRLNLSNPSAVAQKIGQGTLKRICSLTGTSFPPNDTTSLYGKPLSVKVDVEEFVSNRSGNTLRSNKITAYNEADKATGMAPQQQAPTLSGTTGNDVPW